MVSDGRWRQGSSGQINADCFSWLQESVEGTNLYHVPGKSLRGHDVAPKAVPTYHSDHGDQMAIKTSVRPRYIGPARWHFINSSRGFQL